jgi:D-3-phosphoglycerate dehydrogenase / 2-oxoglutarate reductase
MDRFKILVSAPYVQQDIERFLPLFEKYNLDVDIPPVNERMEESQLMEIISRYHGVISGDDRITENVFKEAGKLKVISKWGTGIDSIDSKAAAKYNVKVCNTPNAFSVPVSDTVLGFILNFSRNITASDQEMKNGEWIKIKGKTLNEQTLGIIGLGNVGEQVAKRANAFGMKIIVNDIRPLSNYIIEQLEIEIVSKDVLYERSDFISINCDLNEISYHLLSEKEFEMMSKVPFIINTARGPIINQDDLIKALENKYIAGAGLDVFEFEPLPVESPLRKMKNVFLASHNSNSSPKYWEKVHINTFNNLLNGLYGTDKIWIDSL